MRIVYFMHSDASIFDIVVNPEVLHQFAGIAIMEKREIIPIVSYVSTAASSMARKYVELSEKGLLATRLSDLVGNPFILSEKETSDFLEIELALLKTGLIDEVRVYGSSFSGENGARALRKIETAEEYGIPIIPMNEHLAEALNSR